MPTIAEQAPARASLLYDPKVRAIAYQVVLTVVVVGLIYTAASNAVANLRAARIASGFGFLNTTSGFDINQTLIPYSAAGSTYGEAFIVGLLNTLVVAVIGIFFATILGFTVGIARLSKNWMISKLAMVYVEVIRNLPLLLQLLFWYVAVLAALPGPRQAVNVGDMFFLSNRGLLLPAPILHTGARLIPAAFVIGIVATIVFARWARRQQEATGRQYPVGLTAVGLILGLPILVWLLIGLFVGNPITFDVPRLQGFNFRGGMQVFPEFVALLVGLTTYTAGFIAEVVRAGILAVSKGQTEAASALGLRPGHILRLVVIPQAMRVIIPPLTSQYLNLTKNSSLAVAIGYPDLVQIFMGTVLNQTGQAVEVVAITMAVYLTISLLTSAVMNVYNRRMAIVER
ncbi:MAG: amino acid transporter permease [Microvirga sp.]|nr:amino acid transporter permease [Microvirga sp.]